MTDTINTDVFFVATQTGMVARFWGESDDLVEVEVGAYKVQFGTEDATFAITWIDPGGQKHETWVSVFYADNGCWGVRSEKSEEGVPTLKSRIRDQHYYSMAVEVELMPGATIRRLR